MEGIYAGIVSYNPNIDRLRENLNAITAQISKVIVYDNGSDNQTEIIALLLKYRDAEILLSDKNLGIAAALNRLMQWGYERNFVWMLSLDQDSVCGADFVENLQSYLTVEDKLGIIAPVIVDRNIGVVGHNPKGIYDHVNTCITSGAFSNIAAWKAIGGFDEAMFIDSVDFEFCYRLRKAGFGVIQVKKVELLHELGNSTRRRFLFWKVQVNEHSALRKYYIARNNIYYPYKHHLLIHFVRGNIRNIWLMIVVMLYETNKKEKIGAIARGWKSGYCE